ncbi:ERG4/ERG24 ergosterol biosynthesis protein [Aspergillus homomorphus CBS 101889]|uniref:Delta(14)-sterol reductase n=1 Tax=Aspergillus homomorphus (strain CBS 101889) TaxID=1450537 RepID=A0A395I7W6_ASPHC|nr:ERG4/ERG24 ergosterol biosynthesis protein [Aspergillus homomorphus CBS 101889]RAL16217.1 ERG4/ERG24 ergosterol biosynthesis protein [Aspergillus homomorphus CBS 101889]
MVEYDFGGPLGAAAITFGLPVLLYAFAFACNDVSGCPVPTLLQPRDLTWEKLKADAGLLNVSLSSFLSWKVTSVTVAYYVFGLFIWKILPAKEVHGTKLVHHDRSLLYRFNAFSASMVTLSICAAGTFLQGAEFPAWTFIADNYVQLLTANVLISYALSIFLYLNSFTVDTKYPNRDLRELAAGGTTSNLIYDFYIGRELNPRVTLPLLGEVDIKTWCEVCPGLTGWILLDLAFVAQQYRNYGYISDSIVFTTAVQAYYVLSSQYHEASILTMMDITTDGMGFMLSFGDLVWVPFLYSTQARYLAAFPVHLGWPRILAVAAVFVLGIYIFKAANNQKHLFRTQPEHPAVRRLSSIQTKRGTRLLTAGWWGLSRHINYFGDWLQALPFSLPTGLAGYMILPAGAALGSADFSGSQSRTMLDGRVAVQGPATRWGMIFTYFYVLYFGVLLIHRERRDDAMCAKKYGEDWKTYKRTVRWRILPWVY